MIRKIGTVAILWVSETLTALIELVVLSDEITTRLGMYNRYLRTTKPD
jgi:hypothetical protein